MVSNCSLLIIIPKDLLRSFFPRLLILSPLLYKLRFCDHFALNVFSTGKAGARKKIRLKNNFDTNKANEWYLFSDKTVNEDQQQQQKSKNNYNNVSKLDELPVLWNYWFK